MVDALAELAAAARRPMMPHCLPRRATPTARQLEGEVAADGEGLDQVCTRIAAGGFEESGAWIAQLHTALDAFAR
jgi:hypothetical protein